MKIAACWLKVCLIAVLAVVITGFASHVRANDLPLAAASPLTGVAFDDRPLLLPVQRNFQMAMLTAGSELGRSCGKMEAYGWRMGQTEQARVNQIFNNTVDRMRMTGYVIAPQKLTSISNDITLFTADSSSRHFIFLWSAGELGLVMTLCETSAPLAPSSRPASLVPSVQVFPVPMDVVSSHLDAPGQLGSRNSAATFTPLGDWVGGYTCAQGYTGGTLKITHLAGKDFQGVFKFYPTEKNPAVPPGSYNVYGQYDAASERILINPGKWIQRPRNFYNTVIVGDFDPMHDTFSAYFQGISGCTSFEGKRVGLSPIEHLSTKHIKVMKKKRAKKVAAKKIPVMTAPVVVAPSLAPPVSQAVPTPPTPASASAPPPPAPSLVPLVTSGSGVPAPAAPATGAASSIPSSAPVLPTEDKSGIVLSAPSKN